MSIEAIKKALKKVYIGEWYISGVKTNGLSVVHNAADSSMFGITAETFEAEYICAANPFAVTDLISEIDRLQRENASLLEDRYKLACAITGGEDAPGLLDSTPTSEIVEIAQHARRIHQDDIDRAMAAESEVERMKTELALSKPLYSRRQIEARVKLLEAALKPVAEKYDSITPDAADVTEGCATHPDNMQDDQLALITLRIGDLRRAKALASTGGDHHGN